MLKSQLGCQQRIKNNLNHKRLAMKIKVSIQTTDTFKDNISGLDEAIEVERINAALTLGCDSHPRV